MREWRFVCNACGDFSLGGWEEVVHTPNLRCPGRGDPQLVELVDRHAPESELGQQLVQAQQRQPRRDRPSAAIGVRKAEGAD